MDDWEQLSRYAREGSQEAFAGLVSRHLNLVYSAARRQVGSAEMAEEVAQTVFLALARQAGRLKPTSSLASWLYVVTRITAQKAGRTEMRRLAREQQAFELSTMNPTPSDWRRLEPLLDEAVATLAEPDRSAILLRFFENQSLREVGATLGVSDDAAQKRVRRALEQLRGYFARRGVAVSATAIAADLSTHAIEAAPSTLGATISSAPFLASAALHATNAVTMTTLQKLSLASALTVILSTGFYETRSLARGTPLVLEARKTVASLGTESAVLDQQRAALAKRAAAARDAGQLSKLGATAAARLDPADAAEMTAWLARVDQLKEAVAANPQAWIPEMAGLTDFDWINYARAPADLAPDKLRQTLSSLREAAKGHLPIFTALAAYLKEHADEPPTQIGELAPYFKPPIDPDILERYEVLSPDQRTRVVRAGVTELHLNYLVGEKNPVDLEYDSLLRVGSSGSGVPSALEIAAAKAVADYAQTHAGQKPTEPSELLPLLPQPVDPEKLRRYLK